MTKESCPDTTPQGILHVAKAESSAPSLIYMSGMKVETADFFAMKPEDRPAWLSEAVAKIHAEASAKGIAASAFDDIASAVAMRVVTQKQARVASSK